MRTNATVEEARSQTSSAARDLYGLIRWCVGRIAIGAVWQVTGHLLLGRTRETINAPVYPGVGFFARPAAGSNWDAVIAHVAGAENPVMVATRDEGLRQAMFDDLEDDETALANTQVRAIAHKDGTFSIGTKGGVMRKVAFVDELNSLRAFVAAQFTGVGHTHATPSGATTATTPVGSPPGAFSGSDVLETE